MKKLERNKRFFQSFFVSWVIILLLSIVIISSINKIDKRMNSGDFSENNLNYEDLTDEPKLTAEQPNSKPFNITQHAYAKNEYISSSLPTNVSFKLVEGWTSKNTTIYFEDVSNKNDRAINGDFTSNSNQWQFYTSDPDIEDRGWQWGGYIRTRIETDRVDIGDLGYYWEGITIEEPFADDQQATLSFDFYYDEFFNHLDNDASLYMAVIIDGIEKNDTFSLSSLSTRVWLTFTMNYYPSLIGHITPNDLTIKIGVIIDGNPSGEYSDDIYFDNIKFDCWTKPNQPDLITVKDLETAINFTYQNSTVGKGKVFIDKERKRTQTEDIIFTVFKNMSGIDDFAVNNITIISSVVKLLNSTISGIEGSKYTINADIYWRTEWITIIPYNYLNCWIEIDKPLDWNITRILDGFDIDQRDKCIGVGLGSNILIVPEGVVSPGLWELESISQNYIDIINLKKWNVTAFENLNDFYVGDLFQVNVMLNDSISLINSILNITIYHPNSSIFWKWSQEPTSYEMNVGNLTVGLNMTVGSYKVTSDWRNTDETEKIDKVGHFQKYFNIIHNVSIEAIEPIIERIAGEPLLIKVNFNDADLSTFIPFATINYNTSYGESGIMAYAGSGIYVADIDTSLLIEGEYYFSFNSSNEYYENQTVNSIITLTIILEPLALEVPRQVISAIANNYTIIQFNITGERFGAPISTINVSTDWHKEYTIAEHNTGNYTLNVSTYEVTSGDIPETYTITISANKTNYGSSDDVVILTVYPIVTEANVNVSLIEIYLNQNFSVKVNYTISATGAFIEGATCTVIWASEYHITEVASEFIIEFNATGLILDYYFVQIKLERLGYNTAYKSFNILLKPTESELQILNRQPLEFIKGDIVNISCRYLSEGNDILNANLSTYGDFTGDFLWNGSCYNYEINTTNLVVKSYFIQVLAKATNYQTQFKDFVFTISQLVIKININETLINYQQGIDNNVTLSIYDESHNKVRVDLIVIYECGVLSGDLISLPNSSFVLDLNNLNLSLNKQIHQVKIIVINPYGENDEIVLNVIMPSADNGDILNDSNDENDEKNTSEDTIIFYILIFGLIFAIIGSSFGIFIKRRYFNMTKFQRDIRNLKHQLLKRDFDKIPQLTRNDVISDIITKSIKMQEKLK